MGILGALRVGYAWSCMSGFVQFRGILNLRKAPFGEHALVKNIGVLNAFFFITAGLPRPVGYRLQRLGGVFATILVWVSVFENQTEPDVEEVGEFRVMQHTAKGWIGDN